LAAINQFAPDYRLLFENRAASMPWQGVDPLTELGSCVTGSAFRGS